METRAWLSLLVRAEIAAKREGLAGREKVLAERDQQIRKALESFDQARQLADLSRSPGARVEMSVDDRSVE